MTTAGARGEEFFHRVGILGAGRLGLALANRLRFKGADVPLWSRRYETGVRQSPLDNEACGVVTFDSVINSDVLLSAIPNRALLDLSSDRRVRDFNGVVFAMGIDAKVQRVREVLTQALVIRFESGHPTEWRRNNFDRTFGRVRLG